MLDVGWSEMLVVVVVAIVVIGPKDLPKAMRMAGYWVGKMRGVARQFRQGFDDMVRESEFVEMEKKWAEENARIMREFPSVDTPPAPALPAPDGTATPKGEAGQDEPERLADVDAILVEQPTLFDEPVASAPEPTPQPKKPTTKRAPQKKAAS